MNCRLLVIDNSTALTSPWKKVLNENFTMSEAVGGYEAVTKLRCEPFDLIIVNISLDCLNGADAIRKIREKFYFIPIIALYAKTDILNLKQVKAYGIQHALSLPVDVKNLIIIISKLIPAYRLTEKSNIQHHRECEEKSKSNKDEDFINVEEKFYEGLSAIATMHFREAVEIYESILHLTNIKHETWLRYITEAHFQLGQCYAHLKEYETSNKYYISFINKAPTHNFVKEALLYLGKNYEAMHNLTKASYYYQRVLNMRPFDSYTTQARKLLTKLAKPDCY